MKVDEETLAFETRLRDFGEDTLGPDVVLRVKLKLKFGGHNDSPNVVLRLGDDNGLPNVVLVSRWRLDKDAPSTCSQ